MKYEGLRTTVMGLGPLWWGQRGGTLACPGRGCRHRYGHGDRRSPSELPRSLESVPIHRYVLGEHRKQDFVDADLIVVNPAVRPGNTWLEIAQQAGTRLTSEIDLFLENCRLT